MAGRVLTLSQARSPLASPSEQLRTLGRIPLARGFDEALGPAGLSPTLGFIALLAFPAMIVGGLDSPFGAVLGGALIGLVQTWTAGYQDELFPWLGDGFDTVMPYVVMIIILLVRPFGLFGTPEVRRV